MSFLLTPSHHNISTLLLAGAVVGLGVSSVSADTKARYNVALRGSLWGNPFNSNFSFDDGMSLSNLNMNIQGNGFNAGAGDAYANWDNLGFAQRSYRGLSLGVPIGKAEAILIGGSVVTYDELGNEKSSPIYGFRASLPLNSKLGLNASRLYSPKDSRYSDGSISSVGMKYQFSKRQNIGIEAVHSEDGGGWQISGESKGRLSIRASYRQTQSGFSNLANPLLRTNRNGGLLNLNYRLSTPLTISANLQRYNDGRGGGSDASSLRLLYSTPKRPQVILFRESWGEKYGDQFNEDGFNLGGYGSSTDSTGFELGQQFSKTNLWLRYAKVYREGSAFSSVNGSSNQVDLRISQQLDSNTRLSLITTQVFGRENRGEKGGENSRGYSFINLEKRLSNGVSVNAGLQHQTSDIFGNSGQAIGIRTGFKIPVGNGMKLGVQYQRRLTSSGRLRNNLDDTVYVSFSRNFDAGKKAKGKFSRTQRKQLAQLEGGVYEDVNNNGHWDIGERGISGVTMNLKGNIQATTDQNGRFRIVDIMRGEYKCRMQPQTLPIELSTVRPTEVTLQLAAGEKKILEFPVMKTGQISGVVFNDINRNGIQDEGETPISEAVVQAEGSEIIGFSDDKGRFTLTGLPPRQWKVFVDTSLMSGELAATNKTPIEIDVPANGDVKGIQLGLAPVQKVVINSFVK